MRLRRGVALGTTVAAAVGGAWLVERTGRRRFTPPAGSPPTPTRQLPADVVDRTVRVSDGGTISVVERGRGPAVVLVHGICLGVPVWAPQLHALGHDHRVVVISQRGHGASIAGLEGFAFDRMARDLIEVIETLDLSDVTLAGHSLGGMVALWAAAEHGGALARRVTRLVLVASTAGPTVPAVGATAALAGVSWSLARAQRRGRGILPGSISAWGARASFGTAPRPGDVELVRSLLDAMSPGELAELLPPLLGFDLRDRLRRVAIDTTVVAGSRDLLTPLRTARTLGAGIPGATVELFDGCGHMVMLEREEELCRILA